MTFSAFVKAHGQEFSDNKFREHWYTSASLIEVPEAHLRPFLRETWFNVDDVHQFQELGINTVRIPVSPSAVALPQCIIASTSIYSSDIGLSRIWSIVRQNSTRREDLLNLSANLEYTLNPSSSSSLAPWPAATSKCWYCCPSRSPRPPRRTISWIRVRGKVRRMAVPLD